MSARKTAFIFILLVILFSHSFPQETPDFLRPIREYTVYDPATEGELTYIVDDTSATFRITIPEKLKEEVYEGEEGVQEEVLYSNFYDAVVDAEYPVLPSFELCGQRGKFFDDGMYACVEVNLEEGVDKLPGGKPGFIKGGLQNLLTVEGEVPDFAESGWKGAVVYLATAVLLGGYELDEEVPDEIVDSAEDEKEKFLESPFFSKPLGFYNWSPELQTIYTRDKWLQKSFFLSRREDFLTAYFIAYAFFNDDELEKQHKFLLQTYSRLTNELTTVSVPYILKILGVDMGILDSNKFERIYEDVANKGLVFSLVPLSRSKEIDLARKMEGRPIAGGNLMDELIKAIKSGEVSLKPDEDSGWYEYQQYALETFLTVDECVEGEKLSMNDKYVERLEEAFRSMLTQARETHIKQLEKLGETSAEPEPFEIDISPELSLEPLPTYYKRVGEGYEFLDWVLNNIFTDEEMNRVCGLREDGKLADKSLSEDLNWIYKLFLGFYIESSKNIGLTPDLYAGELDIAEESLQLAKNWLKNWKDDPLMKKDIRVIVPLGPVDEQMSALDNWAVIGLRRVVVEVEYESKPEVKFLNTSREIYPTFLSKTYTILVPVFTEVITPGSEPLTREEFRTVCDRYKTRKEIIKALEEGEGINPDGTTTLFGVSGRIWIFSAIGVVVVIIVIVIILVLRKRYRGE